LSFSFGLALAWFAIPAVASALAGGIAVVSPVGTSGHYIGGEKECGGVKGGGDVVIKGLICREHNLLSFSEEACPCCISLDFESIPGAVLARPS